MNKSIKAALAATILLSPSLGLSSTSIKSANVLLDLQADVEVLYQHVPAHKDDSPLRDVQQKLSEAGNLTSQVDDIRMELIADVEQLFPILAFDADSKLREIQQALSNKELKDTDVMMDIQANIEELYQHIKEGESDDALREIQAEASKAFSSASQRNKILLNLQADVEMLFPLLREGADGDLRNIQEKLANM